MKRLIAFILILAPLFGLIGIRNKNEFWNVDGVSKAIVATKESPDGWDVLETMELNYITVKKEDLSQILKNIKAEGIMLFANDSGLNNLLKSLNMLVFKEENVNGMNVVYGFTPKYEDYVLVDGKKINVQIASTRQEHVVGFPIILSGF